jgi:hypothetical protein
MYATSVFKNFLLGLQKALTGSRSRQTLEQLAVAPTPTKKWLTTTERGDATKATILSCGPIAPLAGRRARIVAARLDIYRPSPCPPARVDGRPFSRPRPQGFYSTSGAVGEMLARSRAAMASFIGNILPMSEPMLSTDTPAMAVVLVSVANWTAGRKPPSAIFMTRACASVVEARGSFSVPRRQRPHLGIVPHAPSSCGGSRPVGRRKEPFRDPAPPNYNLGTAGQCCRAPKSKAVTKAPVTASKGGNNAHPAQSAADMSAAAGWPGHPSVA